MTQEPKAEGVGWVFWIVTFLLFLGPCFYGVRTILYDDVSPIAPFVFGLLAAAFAAGIVSWLVNTALHTTAARKRNAEQQSKKPERNQT